MLVQFRCSLLPRGVETGRYCNRQLEDRLCTLSGEEDRLCTLSGEADRLCTLSGEEDRLCTLSGEAENVWTFLSITWNL